MKLGRLQVFAMAAPPPIVRAAEVAVGTVFWYWGRPLKVLRVHGTDAAAPVILEELAAGRNGEDFTAYAAGQLSMWSLAEVRRIIATPNVLDRPASRFKR